MQKISSRVVPPGKTPQRGYAEATRSCDRNGSGRLPFIHLTVPQRLQLESTLFGIGSCFFAVSGAYSASEGDSFWHLCAFFTFAVLAIYCCCGVFACFNALNSWLDYATRVTRHQSDTIDILSEKLSSQRGTVAGSAGNGMRALNPLPAEVFNLSDHRRG